MYNHVANLRPFRKIVKLHHVFYTLFQVYRIFGQTCVFFPTDSMADFYTSFDVMTLIDVLKTTLQFLTLNWNMAGRPTLCLYLTERRLKCVCVCVHVCVCVCVCVRVCVGGWVGVVEVSSSARSGLIED